MSAAGDAAGSAGSSVTSAIKQVAGGGAILGGLDIAEGGGLDRARGAVGEAINGLQQAAASAGDVLRGLFGCLPWESSCDPSQIAPVFGGNVTNSTTMFFVDVLSMVV